MKILAFSDLHGSKAALKRLLDKAEGVDALGCAGDADFDLIVPMFIRIY